MAMAAMSVIGVAIDGRLKETQRFRAKSAGNLFVMAVTRLNLSGGMVGVRNVILAVNHESASGYRNIVFVHNCFVSGWPECVGRDVKQITEKDRVAARALAKRMVAELGTMEWHRKGNEAECSQRVSEAIQQEAINTGLNPLLLKSMIYRLQRGEV